MPSRKQLENEDVKVLAEMLAKRITSEVKTASVDALAPLFRVADKLSHLLKRGDEPKAARKPRKPKAEAPEVTV